MPPETPRLGVIGIVEDALRNDYFGTVRGLRERGFEGLETSVKVLDKHQLAPEDYAARMRDCGMAVPAVHALKYDYHAKGTALLETVRRMGAERLCIAWGPTESQAQIEADASLYNEMGSACREMGLQLTYHNHHHEFAPCEETGESYLDLLFRHTDPELVKVHFDIAWCFFAGGDPVKDLKRFAHRLAIVHLKDLASRPEGGSTDMADAETAVFEEVGDGLVPVKPALEAIRNTTAAWLVVEQDRLNRRPAWESVERSFANVAAMRGRLGR